MSKADEHFFQVNKQDKDYTSDEKGDMSFFRAKQDDNFLSTDEYFPTSEMSTYRHSDG